MLSQIIKEFLTFLTLKAEQLSPTALALALARLNRAGSASNFVVQAGQ